jgi:hypothetical protein
MRRGQRNFDVEIYIISGEGQVGMSKELIQFNFRKILLLSAVAICLLIADVSSVSASCMELGIKEAFSYAKSVFLGKLIDTQESLDAQKNSELTFEVSKIWKGRPSKYITIVGSNIGFEKGHSYLIYTYADEWNGRLILGGECPVILPIPIERAKENLDMLGVGENPPLIQPYMIFGLGGLLALIGLYSRMKQ